MSKTDWRYRLKQWHNRRELPFCNIIVANAFIGDDQVDKLGLAQAIISRHLRELKNAGLIQAVLLKEGVSLCNCIEPKARTILHQQLIGFLDLYVQPKTLIALLCIIVVMLSLKG